MEIAGPRKRLEIIELDVIPSMFVGVLSKDDKWLEHTLVHTLPELEAKALRLAKQCLDNKECKKDEKLCDEARIRSLFEETRSKLEKEHRVRSARARFHH